jgi:hypothetical protein
VQFQGRFLEPLVKKVLVAKLKLRCERVLNTVSSNFEASGWRGHGFTSAKVDVSAWTMGD